MATLIRGENSAGHYEYYRAERTDSSGRYILANAASEMDAEERVNQLLAKREAFLSLSFHEQLKQLTTGRMTPDNIQDSVKLIAAILIDS